MHGGECIVPDVCVCTSDWTGYRCDTRKGHMCNIMNLDSTRSEDNGLILFCIWLLCLNFSYL